MRTATKSKAPKARRKQPATKTKQPNVQQPADLYFTMVNEMLCVENQILAALPQIVELASDEELKSSLSNHQKQTEQQRDRLKKLIGMMNRQEMPSSCPSIKALLQDGQKMAQKVQPGALRDLAVIAACTKVEYFEMSAYRSLMSMAEMNDFDSHLDLLEETFDEEKNAAQILSRQASQMDLPQMQQQKVNEQQSANAMQSMPPNEEENQKEKVSMRGSERERDSQGRFMSDDDDRGGRRDYNRGSGGGRGRNDDDDDRPGWRGDPQGHSEAARKGWENRGGGGGRSRYDDDDRDYNRGRGGGGGRGRNDDDDGRGWYGDPRGHSEAAREGWRTREREGSDRYDEDNRPGWYGDPRGHSEAAREGWRTREREGNDTYDEGNRPGWYGDPRGHSEAAREGWRDRGGSRGGGREYESRGGGGRGRYDDDDDDRGGYNRGGGGRGRGDDDDRPGWRGDPQGHSEAARKGWETREREGRGGGRGGGDYDDDRGGSSRGGGRGRNDDDDDRGWYGDPRGHSEAARKGWQNRGR